MMGFKGWLRRTTRPARHGVLWGAFWLFRLTVAAMPRRAALALGAALGTAAYFLSPRSRRAAEARIRRVLAYDAARARATCREMYRHFAYNLIDLMIFAGWRRSRFARRVAVRGYEHLQRAMDEGRGVVGLTAHFCVWELFGGYVASRLGGIAVLAHPAYDRNFDRLLVGYRRRLGVRTIYRQEPAAVPLGWLRAGGFLGVLADQNIPDMPWVEVPFLGLPARTPVGPVVLARRARAPLLPMYIRRRSDRDYEVIIEPPLELSGAPSVKDAVREDTAAWSERVGAWVRADPAQWVWVHDRWGEERPAVSGGKLLDGI